MSNVFNWLQKLKKPFLFTSTQMSDMSHTVYGNLKLLGERYTESLGGLVVKMWNVYGIEREENKSHVITDFILKAKKNNIIDLITTGEESRQFLYVKDCCEALYILSKNYESISKKEKLHITSFKWHTILEVANIVSSYFNCRYIPGSKIDRVQNKIRIEPDLHIFNYWEPSTSLEEGIKCIIKEMNL